MFLHTTIMRRALVKSAISSNQKDGTVSVNIPQQKIEARVVDVVIATLAWSTV